MWIADPRDVSVKASKTPGFVSEIYVVNVLQTSQYIHKWDGLLVNLDPLLSLKLTEAVDKYFPGGVSYLLWIQYHLVMVLGSSAGLMPLRLNMESQRETNPRLWHLDWF